MEFHMGPVVVFDEKMYRGNGLVRRWIIKVGGKFGRAARRNAPFRSTELRKGIHGNVSRKGARVLDYTIRSDAEHTMYVIRGTTGPIMTTQGWANRAHGHMVNGKRLPGHFMPIPKHKGMPAKRHGGEDFNFLTRVRGQKAQNFFLDAWKVVHRQHRAIGSPPAELRNP
jgi:hypothetical protein